jgi:hypothetical protein
MLCTLATIGCMSDRTTIVLDPRSRRAAEELAAADRISLSEAIRRAVLVERERRLGRGSAEQVQRRQALERLFELFSGHDAEAEIAELKRQDESF